MNTFEWIKRAEAAEARVRELEQAWATQAEVNKSKDRKIAQTDYEIKRLQGNVTAAELSLIECDDNWLTAVGALTERAEAAEAALADVSAAIGSVRFMDPPDGGDVSLSEQVRRMRETLEAAERQLHELSIKYTVMLRRLREMSDAADAVCQFDWSGNDSDAAAAIDRLRAAIASRHE
jgi:hypothetical protein